MAITESAALVVLPLAHMKDELRIQATEVDHDTLLTSQIVSAVSHVSRRTGATGDALLPLRSAAVAIVRALYDGDHEVGPRAAHEAWMKPFESYERG